MSLERSLWGKTPFDNLACLFRPLEIHWYFLCHLLPQFFTVANMHFIPIYSHSFSPLFLPVANKIIPSIMRVISSWFYFSFHADWNCDLYRHALHGTGTLVSHWLHRKFCLSCLVQCFSWGTKETFWLYCPAQNVIPSILFHIGSAFLELPESFYFLTIFFIYLCKISTQISLSPMQLYKLQVLLVGDVRVLCTRKMRWRYQIF